MKYVARVRMRVTFPNPIFTHLSGSDHLVDLKTSFNMVVSSSVMQVLRVVTNQADWLFGGKPFQVISEPERVR